MTLVAVTVTVWMLAINAGGVYRPAAEIEPVPPGTMLHVTEVLTAFVTVAVNCWVCEATRIAVGGATLMATGSSVTWTEADFVLSTVLFAVIVTVCCAAIRFGAV